MSIPFVEALIDFSLDRFLSFFSRLTDNPVCLHSGDQKGYSYFAWSPSTVFRFYSDRILLEKGSHTRILPSENLFDFLKKNLPLNQEIASSPFFASGAIGYAAYEASFWADSAFPRREVSPDSLLGWWGIYDPIVVFDHQLQKLFLASWGLDESGQSNPVLARERVLACKKNIQEKFHSVQEKKSLFTSDESFQFSAEKSREAKNLSDYLKSIHKILEYIRQGDCYQVNFSYRLQSECFEPPSFDFFWKMTQSHPASFSAFLDIGESRILSFSPEEFLTLSDGKLTTRPIKGTCKRGDSPEQDCYLKETLKNSEKEKAELLMIVDLERNDLGKICEIGSVQVSELSKIETLDYVHHQVATIVGKLKTGTHPIDAIRILFPGGSVTGAPKKRAMEIIQELETTPRGVYTGLIGFFDYSPMFRFNIPIRTAEWKNKKILFGVGGGIVADSIPEKEYEETVQKTTVLFHPVRTG